MASLALLRHAEHRVRLGLDDRDGNLLPLLVEDLGHTQLFPNDSDHLL
jgi:hypothetical protein